MTQTDKITLTKDKETIIYPESDGKPMGDNTRQTTWIVFLFDVLEALFATNPDVFVAANLLWYPIQGDNVTRIGPDVMVVFGRPKGHRGSYRQWEEAGLAPQVVFEVKSPGNTKQEMQQQKALLYTQYGCDEYYLYDPERGKLRIWVRQGEQLVELESSRLQGWVSPRLQVRLELVGLDLAVYDLLGQRFTNYTQERAAREHAEVERKRAEILKQQAETENARLKALLRQANIIDPEGLG
jgi:Uma2 family endonuclease